MGLNRRLRVAIEAGLRGEHQQEVESLGRRLPNFIIIGAAKSATTTLTTILPRHPDFFISRPKEPKFFGRCYDRGWDWYSRMFREGKGYKLRGEGSTMYASALNSFAHAPALMHRYLPNAKLIYVVRHPLDRIISHWRHRKGRKPRSPGFEALLRSRHLRKLVVGCSMYHEQLQKFRQYYPDNQIHCLTYEDLISAPYPTLAELLTFLKASTAPSLIERLLDNGQLPRVNEAGDKGRALVAPPEWTSTLRSQVLQVIQPDAVQMLAYMNKSVDTWTL